MYTSFLIIKNTHKPSKTAKEGFGQLLLAMLAMLAVFVKFGKSVWEAALSPIKVSNNFEY